MKLFTVSQMTVAERAADAAGHSYADMMETAGRAVAEAIIERYPVDGRAILLLVGPGNNGGDALVAGRYLHWAGGNVAFYLFKARDPAEDPNLAQIQELGLPLFTQEDDQRFRVLRLRLNGVDIVVDGLLGTGVTRPIEGEMARLLRQVSGGLTERAGLAREAAAAARGAEGFEVALTPALPDFQRPPLPPWRPAVVAVDCPSGLHCDTGELDPLTLPADLTVTFAGPKWGHVLHPGAGAVGQLVVADIGISPTHTAEIDLELATPTLVAPWLPERPSGGHKGSFGRVLIAAGADPYRGAPVLTGKGALRTGAGLVTLAVPQVVRPSAAAALPEATFLPLPAAELLDAGSAGAVVDALAEGGIDALACGPGLSRAAAPFLLPLLAALRARAAAGEPLPLVLDADALNILAAEAGWPALLPPQTILTPHPGEMARLCGLTTADVAGAGRIELAREKAAAWGCVILLKGAYTVVAAPDGRAAVLPFANPLLAAGGSGDVLTGGIAALLGQGAEPFPAAVAAGYLHGVAAELARFRFGAAGLLASELADEIPLARQRVDTLAEASTWV